MVILKKKWLAAVLAGALLAAALLSGCSSVETVKRLRFGVAGEGGIYREFGERFAALENETDNGQVELKATAGSAANLRLLAGEYLQLAIAQADLVQDAYDQTGIFADEEEDRGFGAVAALYTETCQVVVRADSDIQSIEDLHGRTVSIGAEESGSEQNARQILSAYGLNDKMVSMVNLNYEDAAAQLKAGRVDAIFMTVARQPGADRSGRRVRHPAAERGRCGSTAPAERLQRLQRRYAAGRHLSRTDGGGADGGRESRSAGQQRAACKAGAAADTASVLQPGRAGRAAGHPVGPGGKRSRGRWHPVPCGCGRIL